MAYFRDIPSTSSVFSAYASLSATIMLIQTIFNQLVPRPVQRYVVSTFQYYLMKPRSKSTMTLEIEEKDGMSRNQIYEAAEIYLCTKVSPNVGRLKISKGLKEDHVTVKFAQCEKIVDSFQGIELRWRFVYAGSENKSSPEKIAVGDGFNNLSRRFFELSFEKKHKEEVMENYVPYVLNRAKAIKQEKKILRLHTLSHSLYGGFKSGPQLWDSVKLEHPSTFDNIAMDPCRKKEIIEDLDRFVERKEFYRKVGKAWKRGYLLYGPPGTGKSSLVAAMANHLKFDIYDLQLKNIGSDSNFRKLLLDTPNRSILVIEDIDCSVELPDRNASLPLDHHRRSRDSQFSLAGLLNFIDGLWSSCGDERIFIFTTNNKDMLEQSLLRPGRMDMHIHMSYLTSDGFKILASNYLGIHDRHQRFEEIEKLIESLEVTPAEVAGELMKSDDLDISLRGLVNFLEGKKIEFCRRSTNDEGIGNGIELQETE